VLQTLLKKVDARDYGKVKLRVAVCCSVLQCVQVCCSLSVFFELSKVNARDYGKVEVCLYVHVGVRVCFCVCV